MPPERVILAPAVGRERKKMQPDFSTGTLSLMPHRQVGIHEIVAPLTAAHIATNLHLSIVHPPSPPGGTEGVR